MKFERLDFESMYFDVYELDEGIYATIFNQELGQSSNAGFFDLGDKTIIFDTLMDPNSSNDLINAAKQFTGKEPFMLINSHWHIDHVLGNPLYSKDVPILSSPETFSKFESDLKERIKIFKERGPEEIKRIKEQLPKEIDPLKIQDMKNDLITWKKIIENPIDIRKPDILINNKITVTGTKRSVDIINVGGAHTTGDVISYFQKEKICFMGDTLFSDIKPTWFDGSLDITFATNPVNFKKIMKEYIDKDLNVYVPGHGTLCSVDELENVIKALNQHYLNEN
ncbi:MAG: MBL fold metallo-hydrolase [Candidatus Lokiarchaeota archaeon]